MLTVLKDACILFLLIYAILHIAQLGFIALCRQVFQKETNKAFFHVLDLSHENPEHIDCLIYSHLSSLKEPCYIITDKKENKMYSLLLRKYPALHLTSREEFSALFTETDSDISLKNESAVSLSNSK